MSICRRLIELRITLNLNQTDFATRINRKQSTYSAYEKKEDKIPERAIIDICRVFHVNEQWLRTGDGEIFTKESPAEDTNNLAFELGKLLRSDDEFSKTLILEYLKLPPDIKKLMRDLVHHLAEKDSKSK
ncbi:helix-turn-helix domain-containing protein [Phascolarctobacterium succinatutens]|jgi:transcriptional regulator with XRE-family HTH domain|uniref:helix-turn-helix domain-containing protein n=1 Tax=Phascolarctobacterium succinatutens TaxID=626940 RepID=UPI0026EF6B1B|nr:helix-turn-helix transcriptional regulator [Phascolarctobacterium succinatutens]